MRFVVPMVAVVALAACLVVGLPDVSFRCERDGGCPVEGEVCSPEGWCRFPRQAAAEVGRPVGLLPTQLTVPCAGWWRWRTGLVLDDGGAVVEWRDQCAAGRHFAQSEPARRPRYDVDGGAVWPDGVDDFLRNADPPNDAEAEFTFVVERPTMARGVFFSAENVTAPDADALCFSLDNAGSVARYVVITASRLMQTSGPLIEAGSVAVISVTNDSVFINGVEASYSSRAFYSYEGTSRRRMDMFGAVRNFIGGAPAGPVNPSTVALREVAWHARRLPPDDRAALVAHIRSEQGW